MHREHQKKTEEKYFKYHIETEKLDYSPSHIQYLLFSVAISNHKSQGTVFREQCKDDQ